MIIEKRQVQRTYNHKMCGRLSIFTTWAEREVAANALYHA